MVFEAITEAARAEKGFVASSAWGVRIPRWICLISMPCYAMTPVDRNWLYRCPDRESQVRS
jgi:hypothetical protein